MQNSLFFQSKLSKLPTDLQMNYNGHFVISISEGNNQSRKFIENNKDRNWNEKQIQKFAAFLYYHHQKMLTIDARKTNKIFKLLSYYVQTRNINQCRTFTMKMIKKFGNLSKLNSFFEQSLPFYTQVLNRQKCRLQNIKLSMAQPKQRQQEGRNRPSKQQNLLGFVQNKLQQCKKQQQLKPTDTEYHIEDNKVGLTNKNNQFHHQLIHHFYRQKIQGCQGKLPIFQDSPILQRNAGSQEQQEKQKKDEGSDNVRKVKVLLPNPRQYKDILEKVATGP